MSFTQKNRRMFPMARAVFALLMREIATTYGRYPGGYIWAILEPIGAIAILSAAFSLVFASPALGLNFPLFYATGYLPYTMYSQLSSKLAQSIRYSRPLLFYPSVTFIDAIFARFLLNVLTDISVFVIVMFGIVLVYGLDPIINLPMVFMSLAMVSVLGLGVGVLNCFLFMMFPVWEQVWGIINRPLFIVSGVFFLFESMPEPYRSYLWFNPLIQITGYMRGGFYSTYDSSYVSLIYVFGIGLTCLVVGLILLSRYHRYLLNER